MLILVLSGGTEKMNVPDMKMDSPKRYFERGEIQEIEISSIIYMNMCEGAPTLLCGKYCLPPAEVVCIISPAIKSLVAELSFQLT